MEMDVLKIYQEVGALRKGHFLLSAGVHSPVYMQSSLLMQYPSIAKKVLIELSKKVAHLDFTTIVAPALGGITTGYQLAEIMDKRAIFTERENNIMTLRRGFTLEKGTNVLIMEDVVATGKSVLECVDVIKRSDVNILGIACIVNRHESNPFAEHGYDLYSMLDYTPEIYLPEDCPLCKTGDKPIKPGSRIMDI